VFREKDPAGGEGAYFAIERDPIKKKRGKNLDPGWLRRDKRDSEAP